MSGKNSPTCGCYMLICGHIPVRKLLFMGNEFGQTTEWNYKSELEWQLMQYDCHRLMRVYVTDLNKMLVRENALYENQFSTDGFEWVDLNHRAESVMVFKRKGKTLADELLVILNMTPVVRNDWEIYLREKTYSTEIFNSDKTIYWGTGNVFNPDLRSELVDKTQGIYRLRLNLPPLACIILK